VDPLRLKLTNALREGLQDLDLDARVRLEQRMKLSVANDEHTRSRLGCHGRASGTSVDQPDFTNEIARTELRDQGSAALHSQRPFEDDEELLGSGAFGHQGVASRHIHLVRQPADLFEISLSAPAEKRYST